MGLRAGEQWTDARGRVWDVVRFETRQNLGDNVAETVCDINEEIRVPAVAVVLKLRSQPEVMQELAQLRHDLFPQKP